MHIISNIALISINETMLFQLISFLVFLFIINRIMFRPLQGVMDNRKNHMDKIQTDTVDAIKELENLTQKLKAQESEVRAEALELKRKVEDSGGRQAAEILAASKKEIETLKKNAEMEVKARIDEERKHLQKESQALAVSVMEKLLDRRVAP
ncbi:MAG: ATP synthase F0 subunit B [Deltaproteobacteria bacterium]|nr:ATP synthase F0 subunit B [Deltaproteobacteria bacterium]MBW2014275.1 ATP synthase F0 subunit B [Deltaproteobacteria bacterium]MBW2089711.1 ATP synthase F0 subunit B [Deltaproteobacteria bacterium]MBW2320873.1 ATP synthase F0 subunit B [Deltaproteobacteria bacterium]